MDSNSYTATNILKSQRKSDWKSSIFTLGDISLRLKLSARFIRFFDSAKLQTKYIQSHSLPDVSNDYSLIAFVNFDNDQMTGDIRESNNLYNISIVTQSNQYQVEYIENYEQIICLQSQIKVSSYCASRKRALFVKKQFTKKFESNQFTISSLPLTIQCWVKVSQIVSDATFLNIQNLFKLKGLKFQPSNPIQSHFALETDQVAFLNKVKATQPYNEWLYYTYEKATTHSAIYINQNQWYNKTIAHTATSIANTKLSIINTGAGTVASFEGYLAGLAIYQQVATSSDIHSRLSGIKIAESLLFYFHFADFQTDKTEQTPLIQLQIQERYKLTDAVDLTLAPYDTYLSDDANVYINKCQAGYFYNSSTLLCQACSQNCQFCISQSSCIKCKSSFYQAATQTQGVYTCEKCDHRCIDCFGGTNSDCNLCRYQKLNNKCQCLTNFIYSAQKSLCEISVQSDEQTLQALNEINTQNTQQASQIFLQIDQQFSGSSSTAPTPGNTCGCANQGVCNEEQKECTCPDGFKGELCQYTSAVFDQIASKKNQVLNSLEKELAQGKVSNQAAISIATNLVFYPDTITPSSFDKTFEIFQILKKNKVGIGDVSNMLSATSKSALSISKDDPGAIDKLVYSVNSVLQSSIADIPQGASISITTEKLQIDAKKQSEISGTNIGSLKIQTFLSQVPNGSISTIKYKDNIYKNVNKDQKITSQLVEVNLYSGPSNFKVNNDKKNHFILRFDITNIKDINQLAQQFYEGQPDESEVARRKREYFEKYQMPACYYWDIPTKTWRQDGCAYHDLLQTELLCKCNHLSFFSSFFKTGLDILLDANIGVIFEVWGKSLKEFVQNYGFYSVAGFWVFFFIIKSIVDACDRKYRNKMTMQLILADLGEEGVEKDQDQASSLHRGRNQNNSLSVLHREQNEISIDLQLPIQKQNASRVQEDKVNEEENDRSQLKLQQNQFEQILEPSVDNRRAESKLKTNISFSIKKVQNGSRKTSLLKKKTRISSISIPVKKQKGSKCKKCVGSLKKKYQMQLEQKKCCLCCRLCKKEVQANNLLFNSFARTSLIYSRSTRLTLFWVSILTTLLTEALFFDMSGAEDSGSFWDNVIENFWVEVWSMVITVPLIMLIGLLLRLPKDEITKKTRHRIEASKIRKAVSKLRKKYKSRQSMGLAFMYFLMIFESFYFICFFALAKENVISLWLDASIFVVFLDVILFEIAAGVIVAIMVVFSFSCKCGCSLVVVYLIEIVRNLKNLTN